MNPQSFLPCVLLSPMNQPLTVRAGRTAAMVMLLVGEKMAITPAGKRLIQSLDLTSGEELAEIARRDSPAAAHRIHLRKALIRTWMSEIQISGSPITRNIFIPGAGLAPLALDWCSQHEDAHATEMDYEHVEEKQRLIAQCADASVASRIRCVECDLRNIAITERELRASGWNPHAPALWIIEGLSYYISHQELVALIRFALAGDQRNRVIMEFSGPRDTLTEDAREATERYHQLIANLFGGNDLAITNIEAVLADSGAELQRLLHPAQIEELLGLDHFFHGPQESSMRIALLAPRTR